MAVDHGRGVEPDVPVVGPGGAAPLGELRVAQHPGGLPDQREVVHQHGRRPRRQGRQPRLRRLDPGPAPLLHARIRVGVQPPLVGAHHPGLVGAGQALGLGPRAVRPERVVVEQEQRHDPDRAAGPVPDRVGVLGGEHAQLLAELHQPPVALLTAKLDRVGAVRPQVVVTRHPDDLGEALAEGAQRPLDVRQPLPHVARHQQPVRRRPRPQALHQLPVLRIGHMQVADREQARLSRHG